MSPPSSTALTERSATGPGTRSYLRRRNSLAVLEALWDGPQTMAELTRATGISRTAAESVANDLIELGWLIAAGPSDDRPVQPGRPAAVYRFARTAGLVAGVDIGAHHVSAAIADLTGEALAVARVPAEESLPAAERLDLALATVRDAIAEAGVSPEDIWIVTVGSPGVLDDGRVIHFGGDGMPGWQGLDIAERFAAAFDRTVVVGGDCALGALAERWRGAAVGAENLVYLLSGVRTGAALVLAGELYRGTRGGAGLVGELAELRWRELEHEAYGAGYARAHRPSRAELFAFARDGDERARAAVDDFAGALALGASAMVLAVDPEVLVIGGPNASESDVFLDTFTAELSRHCPLVPRVIVSQLGPDAVLLGSIRLGTDHIHRALRAAIEVLPAFPAPSASLIAA